jgi:hypothetical protein
MTKTFPTPRSVEYTTILLDYADLAKKLRNDESSIMKLRGILLHVEKVVLEEISIKSKALQHQRLAPGLRINIPSVIHILDYSHAQILIK